MILEKLPEPEQIRSYLGKHGWAGEEHPVSDVEIFTYCELSDDGEPITVFVPDSSSVLFYPLRVRDILVTIAAMEEREEDAVRADIVSEKWDVKKVGTLGTNSEQPAIDKISSPGKP